MKIRKKMSSVEITDAEFFFSNTFNHFMNTVIEGITKRYNRPVVAKLVNKVSYVAKTDNSRIFINYDTDWIKNAATREEKFYIIIGILLHEIGHLLYTNFSLMRDSMKALSRGCFYPAIEDIPQKLNNALTNGMGTVLVPLYAEYDNIIEDGYIENAVLKECPGYGECLSIVRKLHADDGCKTTYSDLKSSKTFNANEALQHLVLQYAKFYIDLTDGIEDELTEVFNNCKSFIEKAVVENDPKERKKLINETFSQVLEFLLDKIEDQAENQQQFADSDSDESDFESDTNSPSNNSSNNKSEEDEKNSGSPQNKNESNANNDSEEQENSTAGTSENNMEQVPGWDIDSSKGNAENIGDNVSNSDSNLPSANGGKEDISDEMVEENSDSSTKSKENSSSEANGDSSDTPSSSDDEGKEQTSSTASDENDSGKSITPEELKSLLAKEVENLLEQNNNSSLPMDQNQQTIPVHVHQLCDSGSSQASHNPIELDNPEVLQNQTDLSYLNQLVEEEVEAERERSRIEKQMKKIADTTRKSRNDKWPSLESYDNPSFDGAKRYNDTHSSCDMIARRVVKNLDRVLKERKKGDYDNGLYVGKMLDSKHAYRKDRRIMQNKILPEDTPNLEVCVLVDCSGSMCANYNGSPRIEYARQCAYITWKFCQIMNIPCSVYGHTTTYTSPEKVKIMCAAHPQSKDGRDGERIFSLEDDDCNRDGWAINFCCEAFVTGSDTKKLLFIISDGLPNAEGYNSFSEKDMREVVARYKKKGIKIMTAGIGEVDSIRSIYIDGVPEKERATFMDFSDLDLLPKSFAKIIKKELD